MARGVPLEVSLKPADRQAPRRRLWDRESLAGELPSMSHEEIMSGDGALLKWLTKVEEYGFALATAVPISVEATRELATRVGYVRETIFGGMWDFTANLAFKDTAYTSQAIGPHTDGTYSFDSPGFQMFHCLQFDGTGGDSTLVDGFKVAEDIRRSDPEAFEVLSERESARAVPRRRSAFAGGAPDHRARCSSSAGSDRL